MDKDEPAGIAREAAILANLIAEEQITLLPAILVVANTEPMSCGPYANEA